MKDKDNVEMWAVVELFGRQRVAGLVTEATIGGQSFIRVDVPAAGDKSGMTKFYGNGAIYCITPTTEGLARTAAEQFRPRPVTEYDLARQAALPYSPAGDDEDEEPQ